ncbi:triple tyrosine motif-containing protein [Duganella sp. Dugasp56]|uniref:sensor histidine kinase n=1 Tax=Duganella sp. Dugasp56 TaxID=3243046 RepID=UPI0039AF281E
MNVRRGRSWRALVGAAMLWLACAPAAALNPDIRLDDYNHASWTARDGAPGEVKSLAQTPDGWLWLGTTTGLFRFDGVRFERYVLPINGEFARRRITELRAQDNGDLWISYMVGSLSVLHKDGRLEDLPAFDSKNGRVMTLAPDSDGGVWIASDNGLFLHAHGQPRKIGPDQGLPELMAKSVLLDQYGQVWTINALGLYRLDRATGKFQQVLAQANDAALIQSPDGRLWLADGQRLQPVPLALSLPPGYAPARALPRSAGFNPAESRWAGQFDRDGNLWTQHCPQGLCVVARGGQRQDAFTPVRDATDTLNPLTQMSARAANVIMEDREGNIWIATQGGLDRFRENRLIPARVPLSAGIFSMAGDTEGGVWATTQNTATAWRLAPGKAPQEERSQPFSVVANARDGALLLAGRREIERRLHGQVSKIPLPPGPDGQPTDLDVLGLQDDGKVLWMAASKVGLMGYVDGRWLPRSAFTLSPRIFLGAPGRGAGQRWHATADGMLVFNDNGKMTTYDGRALGLITSITAGEDVVAGGDQGLAVLQGQGFRMLKTDRPDALVNISGMAITADGDRWLNGAKGVVHVRRDDWRDAVDHPDAPLRYELTGALDGYPGQAMVENRLPSVFADRAGQLWFMASGGIVRLAPGQIRRNGFKPEVRVLRIDAGAISYAAKAGLRLPPGSQDLDIQFTAPGLGKPEAMRFQYRLSGVNGDWLEAGGRRTAYYTNLGPGSYSFRVRAWNDDGVPVEQEALLEFEIAPTFVQSIWFKLLCVLAAAGLLYLLYLHRMRVAVERVAERMHVRMAERERIARTLHDTFLQSVQAIILRLDVVVTTLPQDSAARKALEPILDNASDTVVEGRDQVHELRSGRIDDVERAAREAGLQLESEHPGTRFVLMVCGARVKLDALVAEEACEIGREAMRNAFHHAGAAQVEVQLIYEREHFMLQVVDNGKGMTAAEVQGENSPRHYGLVGMRERAARAGGKLDIDSAPGKGTRVTLTVPARLAYAGGVRRGWRRRQHPKAA